jgi:UV damage endonuclease UvdE
MTHSFDQTRKRIGFCCKVVHPDQSLAPKVRKEFESKLTERSTTVAWLSRQSRKVAESTLWDIATYNAESAIRLVEFTAKNGHGMVRLGSGMLPASTHPDWRYFWESSDNVSALEKMFARVGERARELDIRISFHPGQYTVLASDNDEIVERSIADFEYHATLARWMGYGKTFQDFKCNVHISGRRGSAGIIAILPRLSPEARNIITIENDEFSWGLDESLKLTEYVPLVLDIHHHFISTGEYILPTDERFLRVIDSWRGIRPAIHYSYSREEYVGHVVDELPNMEKLLEQGYKKQKLRAHSDVYPNSTANRWALTFWDAADIQCEAKFKNIASTSLYEEAKRIGLVASNKCV